MAKERIEGTDALENAVKAAKEVGFKPYRPRVGDTVAYYLNGDTEQDYHMAFVIGGSPTVLDLSTISVTRGIRTIQGIRQVGDPFFSESTGRKEILFQQGCWEEMAVARKRQDKRWMDAKDTQEALKIKQRDDQKKADAERIQQELGWQIEELHAANLPVETIVRQLGGRATAEQVQTHLQRQGLAAV